MLNLLSNLVLFWLWQTNDQWRKTTASLTAMLPGRTLHWIPVFHWEFGERWGAGDDFSGPDCVPVTESMARGGILHCSPKHFQEGKGLPFGKARFGPCSPLAMEGRRLPAACTTCGKEGIETHFAIYSPQICLLTGVRQHTVPLSPLDLNRIPTLPSRGRTQGSDARYQSNITNVVLSDEVHHCIAIIMR